jgi:hypothetical protein
MARTNFLGTCSFCDKKTNKAGMTRHLRTCAPAHDEPDGKPGRLFHLRVEAEYDPVYWLDLEADARAALYDVDAFLRKIWLECCFHLSAFEIGRQYYNSALGGDWDEYPGMDVQLCQVIEPGARFSYEYDFGSTTRLKLRVLDEREGRTGGDAVRLLARNVPPVWPCAVCEKPATRVCGCCIDDALFCDEHAKQHNCEVDHLLPVVNSPRMGVCAYSG